MCKKKIYDRHHKIAVKYINVCVKNRPAYV